MSVRILSILGSVAVVCLLSCSSSQSTAGGGSDLPNGTLAVVSGIVVGPDSVGVVGAEVILREVVVTDSGDAIIEQLSAVSGADGRFEIIEVPRGRYVLDVARGNQGAFDQFVEVGAGGDTVGRIMRLGAKVDLVGFVALPPGYYYSRLRVSIPGLGRSARVDGNQMYVLEGVPQGYYDICYAYDSVANYMRVRVGHGGQQDTVVQLRNVEFAVMGVMAPPATEFHESRMDTAFAVTPIRYGAGMEPPWYATVDLGRVQYYGWSQAQPVEWRPDDNVSPPVYDMVVSGVVYRDQSGRVVLETPDGQNLVLSGPLLARIGPQVQFVTVALVVRDDGQRATYEVVDIYVRPPQ